MTTIRKLKKIAFPTSGGTAVFDSDDFVYSVNSIKPNVADGNVYIDRVNNANHSDAATKVDQKVSANAVTHTAYPTNATYVPDMSFISFWNGAYSANNQSNLKYCYQGEIIGSSNIAQQSVNYANSCNKANSATTADRATNANHATNADHATNANHATTADTANRAYPRNANGGNINFHWEGKNGQPTWLWGGEDGTNMYVYNPSAFSVNHALNANNATNAYNLRATSHNDHFVKLNWDGSSYFNCYVVAPNGSSRNVRVAKAHDADHATNADTATKATNADHALVAARLASGSEVDTGSILGFPDYSKGVSLSFTNFGQSSSQTMTSNGFVVVSCVAGISSNTSGDNVTAKAIIKVNDHLILNVTNQGLLSSSASVDATLCFPVKKGDTVFASAYGSHSVGNSESGDVSATFFPCL